MRLQAAVLFVLSSMSLMLVDLPGVEVLAGWLRPSPVQKEAPRRPLTEPSEPATPPEPVVAPAAVPEPEPPAPSPKLEVGAPVVVKTVEPASPEPAKPAPPVRKPRPPKNPRPPVEDPFKTEDKPKKELSPADEVQREIDKLGRKLDRCRALVMGVGRGIPVDVTLAPGTGKVSSVQFLKEVTPIAEECLDGVLRTVSVGAVKQGGTFHAKVKL
jgi:hypothetical protein